MLQGFLKRLKERRSNLGEVQEQDRISHIVQERKKSANERELEGRLEKKRQERIKVQLDHMRKEDSYFNRSNVFSKTTILKEDKPILKEKNIFAGQKNMFMDQGSMFFTGG